MKGPAIRLLPAGLIALTLHIVLLSWQLNQKEKVASAPEPRQRIAVSLGFQTSTVPVSEEVPQPVVKPTTAPPPLPAAPAPQPEPPPVLEQPSAKKVVPPAIRKEKREELAVPKKQVAGAPEDVTPKTEPVPVAKKAVPSPPKKLTPQPVEPALSIDSIQPPPAPAKEETLPERQEPTRSQAPVAIAAEPEVESAPEKEPEVVLATPVYGRNPKPKYPSRARRLGWQGVVQLEVEVLEDGSPGQVTIQQSSGYKSLDRAGLKAVKKWRFVPGTINDTATAMKVVVPLKFQIE